MRDSGSGSGGGGGGASSSGDVGGSGYGHHVDGASYKGRDHASESDDGHRQHHGGTPVRSGGGGATFGVWGRSRGGAAAAESSDSDDERRGILRGSSHGGDSGSSSPDLGSSSSSDAGGDRERDTVRSRVYGEVAHRAGRRAANWLFDESTASQIRPNPTYEGKAPPQSQYMSDEAARKHRERMRAAGRGTSTVLTVVRIMALFVLPFAFIGLLVWYVRDPSQGVGGGGLGAAGGRFAGMDAEEREAAREAAMQYAAEARAKADAAARAQQAGTGGGGAERTAGLQGSDRPTSRVGGGGGEQGGPGDIGSVELKRAVIVTAATAGRFDQLANLVGSIRAADAQRRIVVYNLGLLTFQSNAVSCWEGVELRRFPFDSYPTHVRNLYNYAWKVLIWREAALADTSRPWLFLDASVEVRSADVLSDIDTALARDGFFLTSHRGSTLRDTHPAMLDKLDVPFDTPAIAADPPLVAGGIVGFGALDDRREPASLRYYGGYSVEGGAGLRGAVEPLATLAGQGSLLFLRSSGPGEGTPAAHRTALFAGGSRVSTALLPADPEDYYDIAHKAYDLLGEPVLRCALVEECIDPAFSGTDNHRQDMSALSVVAAVRNFPPHTDARFWFSAADVLEDRAPWPADVGLFSRGEAWPKPFAPAVALTEACAAQSDRGAGWHGGSAGLNAYLAAGGAPSDVVDGAAQLAPPPEVPQDRRGVVALTFGTPAVRSADDAVVSQYSVVELPHPTSDNAVSTCLRFADNSRSACTEQFTTWCEPCHSQYCSSVGVNAAPAARSPVECRSLLCTAQVRCPSPA